MKPSIYLIGVGNYTEVIIELAQDCGYDVKGLYHYSEDRVGEIVLGVKIIGTTEELLKQDIIGINFGITLGDNNRRQSIAKRIRKLGGKTPNLIHPKADLNTSAIIGEGNFIHLNAYLWTKTKIGNDCVISPSAIIAHHAKLGNACSVAPFSVIGAYSNIGNRVLFGINSVILSKKLTLGNDCIVGAKANVTKSYKSNTTLVGNPAKPLPNK